MNHRNIPSNDDIPSLGKLIKSTILAICIAAIILVTAVLPAEYGIDPTGIGGIIGLVRMGEIKVSLAQEAAAEKQVMADGPVSGQNEPESKVISDETDNVSEVDSRTDKLVITLKPNEGKEIKLTMAKGAVVNYLWYTNSGKANFDAHADSEELEISYHNYEKGKLERSEGTMEAAFDGNHGWFWRNRTSETMEVTLEVNGSYTDVVQY